MTAPNIATVTQRAFDDRPASREVRTAITTAHAASGLSASEVMDQSELYAEGRLSTHIEDPINPTYDLPHTSIYRK